LQEQKIRDASHDAGFVAADHGEICKAFHAEHFSIRMERRVLATIFSWKSYTTAVDIE
jgi:hypothetical protein